METKPRLQRTAIVTELARADYHLACAGTMLERAKRDEWQTEADDLMRRCIALRERVRNETTPASGNAR